MTRFSRGVRRRPGLFGLVIAVALYAAVYGWILAQRYWTFHTYAWDLGVYNQAFYTTLFSHRLFYYTADLPSGRTGSLLATHFSPALFLVLPFYALGPSPAGLLVIEAAALALGAIPLYFLSRRAGLPEAWSVLLGTIYLLSPVLMGVGWYDFHAEALIPATVLWAIYTYYYGGRWTFLISWLLALAVIESISPLLCCFGAMGLIALGWAWIRDRHNSPETWLRAVVATVLPMVWLGFALLMGQVLFHGALFTAGTGYSRAFSLLGPNLSFYSVIPYAAIHPGAALTALSFGSVNKLAYALILFGSFGFLSLLGPKRLLIPALAWVALVALSNASTLYEFGDQYAAYPLPFIAAGAVFGFARLRSHWWAGAGPAGITTNARRTWRRIRTAAGPPISAAVLVLALGVSSGMVSPLLDNPSWNYPSIEHGLPVFTPHDEVLHEILGFIPPSASILTVPPVFPEVSNRTDAYVVPISSSFYAGNTFIDWLDRYVNESTYVLLDYELDFFSSSVIVEFANLSSFGIVAEDNKVLLLERGWSGPPRLWVPLQQSWAGGPLKPGKYSHLDSENGTSYGPAISSVPGAPKNALLWYGPYIYGVFQGKYTVTFWLNVTAMVGGTQVRLDTDMSPVDIQVLQWGPTSARHWYSFRFSTGPSLILNSTYIRNPNKSPYSETLNDTMTVDWTIPDGVWSVAGWTYTNSTAVRLYAVTLDQISP